MGSQRLQELKGQLDRLVDDMQFDEEPSVTERAVYDEAVRNFRDSGPALLDQATEHLWAYYRWVASEFTREEREDYGIPELDESVDIWDEVQFQHPPSLGLGGHRLEPGRSYLSFEGEVSWEPEHGLQLVFEHGRKVCKVGPYDGHHTVAHAFGDESLLDVVFR